MDPIAITIDMILIISILVLALALFISEIIRIDVAAIIILILLGISGLVPSQQLFDGFASNAVISIIAVMIIGAGLDKTGVMTQVAALITRIGGKSETKIMMLLTMAVGTISSFMQNVGATALFIPVASRVANRNYLALSRLLMPLGFCAILGGTMTMVGSSPLILLNDLLTNANQSLPSHIEPLQHFDLFSITPIGICLLLTGVVYFITVGKLLLPKDTNKDKKTIILKNYFKEIYGIEGEFYELLITVDSPLVGMKIGNAETLENAPSLVAIRDNEEPRLAPHKDEIIWVGTMLGVIGQKEQIEAFANNYQCRIQPRLRNFGKLVNPSLGGISEVVIPPGSRLIGKTIGEEHMRKAYGLSILAVNRGNEIVKDEIRDIKLKVGDCLVIHSSWRNLSALAKDKNFVVVSDIPKEEERPQKVKFAVLFFAIALYLILFTNMQLSLALLIGAVGMILSGVINIDEAYRAVSWKTIFLLASLIPLGYAMDITGTAAWIAVICVELIGNMPIWLIQGILALLATFLTLVMSNVGATVILVPLAINIAITLGADPTKFAIIVALATSNAFILPTHQVNALIMGPGSYKVTDFMRVGIPMTILFIIVMLLAVNYVF